jgi:hypothetical protein
LWISGAAYADFEDDWNGGDVNINNNNNFNRNANRNVNRNVNRGQAGQGNRWQHNPQGRKSDSQRRGLLPILSREAICVQSKTLDYESLL